MIWILLAGLGGVAVVGVAAWARNSRRRVDAQEEARRKRQQLDRDEEMLLAKLKRDRGE